MNVLFLSASTGSGHAKAAEAVMECMKIRYPGSGGLLVDSLKYVSPLVDRLIVGTYLSSVKKTPRLYGGLYRLSETDESITGITMKFNRLLSYRLYDFINAYNPSAVVCTHTFPLQMLSGLKKKKNLPFPVIGIVTDFVSHLFWKLDGVDAFVVAHDYIRNDMIRMGIPQQKIYTYGIPVSLAFLQKKDRTLLLREFGLQNKLTILIMGGSLGIGELRSVLASLLKSGRDLQVIAVTGHNRKLKRELEELAIRSQRTVKVLGYTDRVADLMEVSDFIITKPGGVTVSEALVKKLPIIVMSPIPGQEERNARFLVNTGVAALLKTQDDMDGIFSQIMDNPTRVRHMREMAEHLSKPHAGFDIAALAENLASAKKSDLEFSNRIINC